MVAVPTCVAPVPIAAQPRLLPIARSHLRWQILEKERNQRDYTSAEGGLVISVVPMRAGRRSCRLTSAPPSTPSSPARGHRSLPFPRHFLLPSRCLSTALSLPFHGPFAAFLAAFLAAFSLPSRCLLAAFPRPFFCPFHGPFAAVLAASPLPFAAVPLTVPHCLCSSAPSPSETARAGLRRGTPPGKSDW